MADPVSLGVSTAISIGTSAIGSMLSAQGAAYEGESKGRMYDYQAGVSRINAKLKEQDADYARYVGDIEAERKGMETRFKVGQTKAIQAGSGLDVNFGSPATVRESEEELGRFDQDIIRSDAARRAYGFGVEASREKAQAGVYDVAASESRRAGRMGRYTSLLSGATSVADRWTRASQLGMFSNRPASPVISVSG